MTKKKSTKRALISSLLILAMCFTMLAGTTFAWFTDSVESGNNIIKSGKLSIDLLIDNGNGYVSVKESATPVVAFPETILWEPGYTAWANAKVVTDGNLALKYTMKIAATGEVSKLAEVIDVYYKADEVTKPADRDLSGLTKIGTLKDAIDGTIVINDTLIPGSNAEDKATIALHMQETAGNEYQNLSIGSGFKFVILATQYTYEEDAFDDQYDALAEYPGQTYVATATELKDTFAEAVASGEPALITLEDDIDDGDGIAIFGAHDADITIDLNGKTLEIFNNPVGSPGTESQGMHFEKGNKVVIKNGTIDFRGQDIAMGIQNYADLTLENVHIIFDWEYALSNNNGKVTIKDCTIDVPDGKVAFDVYYSASYPDGTQVTVEGNSVINGLVEIGAYTTDPANNPSTLTINGGTFNGFKTYNLSTAAALAQITKNGGTFNGTDDITAALNA